MIRPIALTLFFIIFTCTVRAQHNDTTFISREVSKDNYHAIYIDRNRQSEDYRKLLSFKMDQMDADGYKENLASLKKRKLSRLKMPADLPREWMPLYSYNSKYYIYSPCEWGYIGRRIITDTTLIYWNMEPPTPERIHIIKKINARTYHIVSDSFYIADKPLTKIVIHIIDAKTNTAVWEYISHDGSKNYTLMVARKNATNFDMIVNYSKNNKVPEFDFDKIDFKKLLKGH